MDIKNILKLHKEWLDSDGLNGERADLSNVNLRRANLSEADLRRANLSGADLYSANLRGTNLRGANLYNADLRGTDLYGADLYNADLSYANLRGANLYSANLHDTTLRGAHHDFDVPMVVDLKKKIPQDETLNMSKWHTCKTTHCLAGWAVTLGGETGKNLEGKIGTYAAGYLIFEKSCGEIPGFFWSNEEAIEFLNK